LTTTCLLGGKKYPAEAIAETAVEAVLLPKDAFQQALAQMPEFRNAVFTSIDKGMNDLLGLLEDISFGRMDARIARRLLQVTDATNRVDITHQTLAEELGTAREVISRLLKGFEQQGWVKLHRGWIEIIDRRQLRDLER
jgi:CRP/FNR family transcriptional regulator